MMRSILVALDDSLRAPHVLATATDLADHYDARLVLMRAIVPHSDFPPAAHVEHSGELEDRLRDDARRQISALAANLGSVRVESVVVAVGEPWRAILDVAERSAVDLIVMGSHGYAGLDHLLGTTAAKVVNHAKRNVLIVRSVASP